MKISIVIPVYNQANSLMEAIDSALMQSAKTEIIVVDDGSTDTSPNVADSYKKIKVIHQVNKGLSSARNTGIMNAKGDYVLFLDADDVLLDNCVARITEEILKTKADIIVPSFKEFGLSNREVILDKNPTLKDFTIANRFGYCSAVRRKVLLEVGGYSPRMTWGYEDMHLWFDLLKRGKTFSVIQEVLWLYRTKEQSMITEANKHHDELMAQIKKDHPEAYA